MTDESVAEAQANQQMAESQVSAPKKDHFGRALAEWVGILIAALLVALIIRTFVVQTFWIPSASMEDTLLIGDRVLVNKLSYKTGDIHREDIVVFQRPPGERDTTIKT